MKLRDIVRKAPDELKLELQAKKRQNKVAVPKLMKAKIGGDGDNAVRGLNDNEGYIQ